MSLTFVTNRTATAKYNISDLNRVEYNAEQISLLLNEFGYTTSLTTKQDWTTFDFPQDSEMQRYIDNINALKNAYYSIEPAPPMTMELLTYIGANNIEKTLKSIYDILNASIVTFKVLQFTLGGGDFA